MKDLKEAIMNYLKSDDAQPSEELLRRISAEAGDFVEDVEPDESFVRVELPPTNVGEIFIQKDFAAYAEKIDKICDLIYEEDDSFAGFEYFSTVCHIIGCKWQMTWL